MEYDIVPLSVGGELHLPGSFIVRPFETTHTVCSQGCVRYYGTDAVCIPPISWPPRWTQHNCVDDSLLPLSLSRV